MHHQSTKCTQGAKHNAYTTLLPRKLKPQCSTCQNLSLSLRHFKNWSPVLALILPALLSITKAMLCHYPYLSLSLSLIPALFSITKAMFCHYPYKKFQEVPFNMSINLQKLCIKQSNAMRWAIRVLLFKQAPYIKSYNVSFTTMKTNQTEFESYNCGSALKVQSLLTSQVVLSNKCQ
jgi:hypothetical protein